MKKMTLTQMEQIQGGMTSDFCKGVEKGLAIGGVFSLLGAAVWLPGAAIVGSAYIACLLTE